MDKIREKWEVKILDGLLDSKFENNEHKNKLLHWLSFILIREKWIGNLDEIFKSDLFQEPFSPPYWHIYNEIISSLLTYPGTRSWLKFLASRPTTWYQWYLVHTPFQNDSIKKEIEHLILQEHQLFLFF